MLYNYRWEDDHPTTLQALEKLLAIETRNLQKDRLSADDVLQKKVVVVERKDRKDKLMKAIEDILSRINDELDIEHQDDIIKELVVLRNQALTDHFDDVFQLAKSAIGRRIYNVQAEKLKIKRKQLAFNWNNYYQNDRKCIIENFPFSQLEDAKFLDKTFIFIPYMSGFGFNYGSCQYRKLYPRTFREIRAEETIRRVNQIYFNPKQQEVKSTDKVVCSLLRFSLFLTAIITLYFLVEIMRFYLFPQNLISKTLETKLLLMMMLAPMMVSVLIWVLLSMWEVMRNWEEKTTFEKATQLINDYFIKINSWNAEDIRNDDEKVEYKWEACKNLFYISVKVDKTIDKSQTVMNIRK